VLSKQKVLFVEEKGFIMRSANVQLDLPYNRIAKIAGDDYHIILTRDDDTRYSIETPYPLQARQGLNELVSK
jgi:hypothetical protein